MFFYVERVQSKLQLMSFKCKHCAKCFSRAGDLRSHDRGKAL